MVPSLSDSQAWNRYAYARDNPILYTDPTGHSFWSWLGDVFSAIGHALSSAWDALGQALRWLGDKIGDGVRFLGKAATYAWETIKGIASNPLGLALFLMGVAMAAATGGATLLVVLAKMAAPIVATSLARAAGVKNPIVLGLIGMAAGLAAGGAGVKDWLKAGAKFAGEKLARAVGGEGLAAVYSMAEVAISNVPQGGEDGGTPASPGGTTPVEPVPTVPLAKVGLRFPWHWEKQTFDFLGEVPKWIGEKFTLDGPLEIAGAICAAKLCARGIQADLGDTLSTSWRMTKEGYLPLFLGGETGIGNNVLECSGNCWRITQSPDYARNCLRPKRWGT